MSLFFCCCSSISAQDNFTDLNDSVINLTCAQNCAVLNFKVPHLKSADNYSVVQIPYKPYPYVTATGNELPPGFYNDDVFSNVIDLPFPICFYGQVYSQVVIGSNGLLTFDVSNAISPGCGNASYQIIPPIPYNLGNQCDQFSIYYPRAAIMGVFSDLNAEPGSSPADRRMEWRIEGTAPFRRFVASWFHIGVFGTNCGLSSPTTFQIVINEATAVVEVFIEQKNCMDDSPLSEGRAILGVQNWNRDQAVAAPGKNAQQWTAEKEGYRFVPSGATSRFISAQLLTMGGAVLHTATTAETTPGFMDISFPNLCPVNASEQYIVRTTYTSCLDPNGRIVLNDTITINKSILPATLSATQTDCGPGNGTATVTIPAGSGSTGPYTFVLNPGNITQTVAASSATFNDLAANSYILTATDGSGLCTNTLPVTITSTGTLNVTHTVNPPSCLGAPNASITVTLPAGMGAVQYTINGSPWPGNVFTGLQGGGTYAININAGPGCTRTVVVSIPQGTGTLSGTAASTGTSCAGVNNGSITVTPTSGSGPYEYSINGGTNWQTSNVFNGLAAAAYNVIIREGGVCTSQSIPVTVTAGSGLTATATPASTSCTGVNNGSISVTTTGTAPFTFLLDGVVTQTSATSTTVFNNLGPGLHSVTVTDATGCTTTAPATATIAVGTGFTAAFTTTATSCAGAGNGSILINPSGGTAPFTFLLSPGAITQTGPTTTFNTLAANTYSVLITDASGCQLTLNNMTVASGAGLVVTPVATPTTCAGINNGSISVTTNGTAPFTFVLDGTVTQTSATNTTLFNNLGAGPHSISVTDANGCMTTAPVSSTVNAGTGFTAAFTSSATSCAGAGNGNIVITPAGGTAPFTFVLNPGAISQSGATATFNALAANSYNALITDASGCQFTLNNMTVAAGAGLQANLSSVATTCAGVNNGTITVTPSSGTAPFTVILDGTITQTGNPVATFINVAAGQHNVTITDAIGCSTTAALTTTVATGTSYAADFTATGTSCTGVNNGSITVNAQSPGIAPFTFVLNPGNITQNAAASTTFTGLAPGNYSVVVTDANGCQASLSNMNVTQGGGLLAGVTLTPTSCFGSADGTITVNPTNGSGPYTFVLDGTITQVGATETTFSNLIAATYTISIRDASGCLSAPISHSITQPALLSVPPPAVQAVSCNGASDGMITIQPTGGTPPYRYSLDNINFKPGNFFNVPQGVYTVYVRDANDCSAQSGNMTVTEPTPLNATIVSTITATCSGGSDGVIQVAAAGGTIPYQYSLDGTNFQSSGQLNSIPGTYDITVRDANNCTFIIPGVVVGLTDNLTLTASNPPPACEGTGVQLQVTSNATSYSWSPAGSGLSNAGISNPVASPSITTLYTVTATLGNCSRTADLTVTVLPAPVADAGNPADICFGQNSQLQGSGGTSYSWSPVTYLDDPNIANPQVIRPDKTITYALSVTDANNCTSLQTDNVTVNVTPPIKIVINPADTIIHSSSIFQLKASSAGTSYTWSPATGLDNPNIPDPTVSGLTEGQIITYQVVTTTAAGCQGEAFVTVRVYKGPEIYIPTAFTPNNDGKNEVFMPVPVGIKKLDYFKVFNRWGQLMFSTAGLNHGWDGRAAGMEQAAGVYIWMIQGVTQSGEIIFKKGTVTLIR